MEMLVFLNVFVAIVVKQQPGSCDFESRMNSDREGRMAGWMDDKVGHFVVFQQQYILKVNFNFMGNCSKPPKVWLPKCSSGTSRLFPGVCLGPLWCSLDGLVFGPLRDPIPVVIATLVEVSSGR